MDLIINPLYFLILILCAESNFISHREKNTFQNRKGLYKIVELENGKIGFVEHKLKSPKKTVFSHFNYAKSSFNKTFDWREV